ncbi:Uncharacterised protein g11178 [Pycnogonum litorale]
MGMAFVNVLSRSKRIFAQIQGCFKNLNRQCSYYPVDDDVSGLTEEQRQLRQTVFQFAQKELAPRSSEIDKTDSFPEFREFWKKLGDLGLHGITVPGN